MRDLEMTSWAGISIFLSKLMEPWSAVMWRFGESSFRRVMDALPLAMRRLQVVDWMRRSASSRELRALPMD